MKFDSAGVVVNKTTFQLEKSNTPNTPNGKKKKKEQNEHEVPEPGHRPAGPSPCRANRSAETVPHIRLANNVLLEISAKSSV
jgi:hypothetical protein